MEDHKVVFDAIPPTKNGQVEAINKIIKYTLKARLKGRKGKLASKLSEVLRSYRMTCRNSTGETTLSLAYGTEDFLLSEISIPSYRTSQFARELNDEARSLDLGLLEEKRLQTNLKNVKYKQ